MFEIEDNSTPDAMVEFGMVKDGKKTVLFQLPRLGSKGVPMGVSAAFAMFYDKFNSGRSLTETEVAGAWAYFIQTLADSFPDATRQLSRMDEDNLKRALSYWVTQSEGFDPKA